MDLIAVFFTGLTAGGLSCLAVQGGLLASVLLNQKKDPKPASQFLTTLIFLIAKLFSHTFLGFLLGSLGGVVALSLGLRLTFQTLTALFMLATAFNLLQLHPIFRYVAIQPPKFLQRLVKKSSKSQTIFAPAFLGLLTIFVPCGVTQAIEVLALNVGQPINSALIMFSFVLGTFPTFIFIGLLTVKLSAHWQLIFNKIAAFLLIIMSLYSINGVLLVLTPNLALQNIFAPVVEETNNSSVQTNDNLQKVSIKVNNRGYNPRYIQLKKDVPVELTLVTEDTYSCALAFVFREFGINTMLDSTGEKTYKFTPKKAGKFTFSCSMGMYSGVMEVK